MDWKLAGLVTIMHADGPDHARSAAGRAAAEGMWVPTALLPRFGVRWSAGAPDEVHAGYRTTGPSTASPSPAPGRAGWFFGTDRWPVGEFFRYRITDLRLVVAAGR
jgi:hypothetical protein